MSSAKITIELDSTDLVNAARVVVDVLKRFGFHVSLVQAVSILDAVHQGIKAMKQEVVKNGNDSGGAPESTN